MRNSDPNLINVSASIINAEINASSTILGNINATADINGDITADANFYTNLRHAYAADYNLLANKPQINTVILKGDKTLEELGLEYSSNLEIASILQS